MPDCWGYGTSTVYGALDSPRMEDAMRVVIIGAGPAGVTVAETLRAYAAGRGPEIVMLTDEPYPPYSPPAMV